MGDEEQTQSKHGADSADKGEGADGARHADNPDEIAGAGGEGDDQGGLGDRTGGSSRDVETEPQGEKDKGELKK